MRQTQPNYMAFWVHKNISGLAMNSCICHATHYRDKDGLTSQAGTTNRLGQTSKEVRATRTQATNYRECACEMHWPLTSKPAVRLPLNVPISNEVEFQAGARTRDAVRQLHILMKPENIRSTTKSHYYDALYITTGRRPSLTERG